VPKTDVVFYAENGKAPAMEWLEQQPKKVQDKFDFLLEQLEEQGHLLRRPYAAPLDQKIYELRARHQQVNYRLLYFFDGTIAAVVAHGCTKEDRVDPADIQRAAMRRTEYLKDRASHTFRE
jgi:hypothetical protein